MKVALYDIYSNEHTSLLKNHVYEVLAMSMNRYRLINIDGEPCLYDKNHFQIVDNTKPDFWNYSYKNGVLKYASPKDWDKAGFFENYFDDIEEDRLRFYKDCKNLYNIDILLTNHTHTPPENDVLCIKKTWYLKPTKEENIFEFIYDKPENINLTINKRYKIKDFRDIWFYIEDDTGNICFYPVYMFACKVDMGVWVNYL